MKRIRWMALALFSLTVLLTLAGIGAAWWVSYTADGTQRLLSLARQWLPQLTVLDPKGAFLGDFQARQITWQDNKQHRITIDEPRWSGLTVRHQALSNWQLAVHADTLMAKRVRVDWPSQPDQPPTAFPLDWRLPLRVTVGDLSVARIESPLIGAAPLLNLKAKLALQQGIFQKNAFHEIQLKSLQWEQWQLAGQVKAQLQAMPVLDVQVLATSPQGRADLAIKGLLERLAVTGQVQVAPLVRDANKVKEIQDSQTLHVSAALTPLSSWPIASLILKANALDLKQISAQLPQTALSGSASLEPDAAGGEKAAMHLQLDMRNAVAGAWTQQRVPVQSVQAEIDWPPMALKQIDAQRFWRAGRVTASMALSPNRAPVKLAGQWDWDQRAKTDLTATLDGVQLQGLHAQAPSLRISGELQVRGQKDQRWAVITQLTGNDTGTGQWPSGVQVQGQALLSPQAVQVSALRLVAGQAKAEVKGDWTMASGEQWQSSGSVDVRAFNPLLWVPALASAKGVAGKTVLSGQGQWKLAGVGANWPQGQVSMSLADSYWQGVDTAGNVQWQAAQQWQLNGHIQAAGNEVDLQASLPKPTVLPKNMGVDALMASPDVEATLKVQGPALAGLQVWATPWGIADLAGDVAMQMAWSSAGRGQWRTSGQASSEQLKLRLQAQNVAVSKLQTKWSLALAQGAAAQSSPVQLDVTAEQGRYGQWQVQQWQSRLTGTVAQHEWQSQGRLDLPPRTSASGRQITQSLRMQFAGAGQWRTQAGQSRWQGDVKTLRADTLALTSTAAWLEVQPFTLSLQLPTQAQAMAWRVSPTRIAWMGLPLNIDQAEGDLGASQRIDLQASLAPIRAAEWLNLWQPQGGWGGDLLVQGQVKVRHSIGQPWFVQAKVARQSGDLTQTTVGIEGASSLALGLRDVELTLDADNGVWQASQKFDGQLLGQVSGQQTIRLRNVLSLPSAEDALSGELQAKIQDVQTLGVWAPAGWRLAGHLQAQAKVSGTIGAPLFSGEVKGQALGAANTLQGIELKRGYLDLQLAASQARLVALTFEGAGKDAGDIKLSGEASLGASPDAKLNIVATRFHVLNRDDRQARVSGQATLVFKGLDKAMLDGQVQFDQGLFDVSRADAPSIGDDVNVTNLPGDIGVAGDGEATKTRRQWQVNLDLNLGEQLRLRGRGLNTRLTGALRLTTPNGRPALKGTVKTVDGTFASYGQKLLIERGTLSFSGPLDNPRLDIKAMRVQSPLAESSDVKVGVVIGGTALDPRVSLYSEPPMSDTEKLSWLVLGRGPTGLGGADIGLLQTAATALLSGEGATPQDTLVASLGLDELSVRQTDGAVRDTIVTVGKRLSSRWYLGYERSLTATEGTWQALYRASQRTSIRLQTGDDNAIDLIWQWRQRMPPSEVAK